MEFEFVDIADLENSEPKVEKELFESVYVQESTSNEKKYNKKSLKSVTHPFVSSTSNRSEKARNSFFMMTRKKTIPTLSLADLIYLILKSENCILTSQIWNYLSGLFPYFENSYAPLYGNNKIISIISQSPKVFLKNSSIDGSMTKLVILNPSTDYQHCTIKTKAQSRKSNLLSAMYEPKYFDDFLEGTLNFSKIKLFRHKTRPISFGENCSFVTDPSAQMEPVKKKAKLDTKKTKSTTNEQIDMPELNEEEEFSPQIIDICTVEDDDKSPADMPTFLETSSLFDNLNTSSEIVEPIDFVNCVWSNDSGDDILDVDTVPEANSEFSFPEVEKCIPKWKEIFPWVTWYPQQRSISCSECQFVHRKCGSHEILAIVVVKNASEIFKVSKLLRQHSEKMSHKITKILTSRQLIAVLHFLLSFHYNDFSDHSDILNSCRALCDNGSSITQESLCFAFKVLSEYLEHRTIVMMKKADRISIVTDACSGIIIVRFFVSDIRIEEHIVSSYMSVVDKSPLEYLISLGINEKKVVHYLTNARCEECTRCSNTKKPLIKSSVPMRLPSLEKFLLFLWGSSLLKPVHSIGSTVRRLWKNYPHRFRNVRNIQLAKFSRFNYNPTVLVDMYENFDEIQESARTIYESNGHVEALGLCHSDTKHLKLLLPLFPILSELIALLIQVKCSYPLDNDQEKLYKCVESMRKICDKWTDTLDKEEYLKKTTELEDLIDVTSLTVKEFFEPIYFKSRSLPLALGRVLNVDKLKKFSTSIDSNTSFEAVFSVIKPFYKYEKDKLYHGLISLLQKHGGQRAEISKMLHTFNVVPNLRQEYEEVYDFFKLYSLMPFNAANINRCIYETKIYERLFYKSAWSGIGPNVKENTLTILSELDNNRRLSYVEIIHWWKEKYLLNA